MIVQVNEVWGYEGISTELVLLEIPARNKHMARYAVREWMDRNRPDLPVAMAEESHGFAAEIITF